jgi:hypothetical protein
METIRKNVFETNSSSCHSITFSEKGSGCRPVKASINLRSNDFGWEEEEYTDSQSKFEYWLACFEDCSALKIREKFAEVLHKDPWSAYPSKEEPLPENVWEEAFEEVYTHFVDVLSYLRDNGVDFYIYYDKDNHELEDYLIDFQLANNYNPEFGGFNFLVEMGYGIDHQSAPYEEQAAYDLGWSTPEEVYDWIFGDGFVKTDNDNH